MGCACLAGTVAPSFSSACRPVSIHPARRGCLSRTGSQGRTRALRRSLPAGCWHSRACGSAAGSGPRRPEAHMTSTPSAMVTPRAKSSGTCSCEEMRRQLLCNLHLQNNGLKALCNLHLQKTPGGRGVLAGAAREWVPGTLQGCKKNSIPGPTRVA